MAECLAVSEEAAKHWQTGRSKPHPRNARKLETVLGVAADVLLANEDGPDTGSVEAVRKATQSLESLQTGGQDESYILAGHSE